MLNVECPSPHFKLLAESQPIFRRCTELPEGLNEGIQEAVRDFIKTSHMSKGVDHEGFYQQTLNGIANSTVLHGQGDFWLGTCDGKVYDYVIGRVVCDIDNRLTYWVNQAWVHKDFRGTPTVKRDWEMVRKRAKDAMCSHITIVSSRSTKAYLRWLGSAWDVYATILKEDL